MSFIRHRRATSPNKFECRNVYSTNYIDMDRLVDDYVGDKIPLWEKITDRQGTVCCAWEKTAFEEGLKVGIRLMMEVYGM